MTGRRKSLDAKTQPPTIQEVFYASDDKEFSDLRLAIDPGKTSAPSANKTLDVIGVPSEEKFVLQEKKTEPGKYKITNKKGKYTIKQGATVGNTLAEVAAQYILKRVGEIPGPTTTLRESSRYAKSFLVTKPSDEKDGGYATAEDFMRDGLYAASRWQPDVAYAANACRLFGHTKRPKPSAGTFHPELFEDIRQLNKECDLGLEHLFHGTALIADLDFHTDNFLLNFDISMLEGKAQEKAKEQFAKLDALFDKKNNKPIHDRRIHLAKMIKIINTIKQILPDDIQNQVDALQELLDRTTTAEGREKLQSQIDQIRQKAHKPCVYFHKIDHDSGLYRFCDETRELSLRDHGSSMSKVEAGSVRMQPTNHLAELLVGESPEEFLRSEQMLKILLANPIEKRLQDTQEGLKEFFDAIHARCEASVKAQEGPEGKKEQLRSELFLLKHFYQHIMTGMKVDVTVSTSASSKTLQKEITAFQEKIQSEMEKAAIRRYIALKKEYYSFIEQDSAQAPEVNTHMSLQLQKDRDFEVFLHIQIQLSHIKASRQESINAMAKLGYGEDQKIQDEEERILKIFLEILEKKRIPSNGEVQEVIGFLSNPKYTGSHLYKAIEKHIGKESMPLHEKTPFKKFREGLAGPRKIAFWAGVGLLSVVAIAAAAATIAFTAGAAIPAVLPALGTFVAGVGALSAGTAAVTNPATTRWFKRTSGWRKAAFVLGTVTALGALTVLTGGAALALVAAVTVVAAVGVIVGAKAAAAAGIATTAVAATKTALITTGAVEGLGMAAHAIKSTSTKAIAHGLGVSPEALTPTEVIDSSRSASPESKSQEPSSTSVSSMSRERRASSDLIPSSVSASPS